MPHIFFENDFKKNATKERGNSGQKASILQPSAVHEKTRLVYSPQVSEHLFLRHNDTGGDIVCDRLFGKGGQYRV